MSDLLTEIKELVAASGEGLSARRNQLSNYAPAVVEYFRWIVEDKRKDIPPPLCVQVQVSSQCPTQCRMCWHWKYPKPELELSAEQWQRTFAHLAGIGVKTLIFSGGEPLQRSDIAILLRSAADAGLRLGLLSSGSGLSVDEKSSIRDEVIETIGKRVDWVAFSIDGTRSFDAAIRNPKVSHRHENLADMVKRLKATSIKDAVSATVTLQAANIDMDLQSACEFIQTELGIEKVNFKLATGAERVLKKTEHLPTQDQLADLVSFLWQNHLPQDNEKNKENNLAYLRRAFAEEVFTIEDAAKGVPVRAFYEAAKTAKLRCFTPFLFSLIDWNGDVYPCCHLYRDNHDGERSTDELRDKHRMGNANEMPFKDIWEGDRYAEERRRLKVIDPDQLDFIPCGECTRHCQHNRTLTKLFELAKGDLDTLQKAVGEPSEEHKRVWF